MDPIKTSIQNLENQMRNLNRTVEEKFQGFKERLDLQDVRVLKLEEIVSFGSIGSTSDVVLKEIDTRKSEIALLKETSGEKHEKQDTDKCKTAIFDGFNTFTDSGDVKEWITNKLWDEWLPQPAEIYHKGDTFKGIFFCRFDSVSERDKVVDNIRRLFLKIESNKIWSNADLPSDVRIPEHFLFGLKKILVSWGYENVWVKKETKSILLGKELILSVSLENMKMQLAFGTFWEEHIAGDTEFKKLLKDE